MAHLMPELSGVSSPDRPAHRWLRFGLALLAPSVWSCCPTCPEDRCGPIGDLDASMLDGTIPGDLDARVPDGASDALDSRPDGDDGDAGDGCEAHRTGLLAYEPFDYDTGPLFLLDGGIGWADRWHGGPGQILAEGTLQYARGDRALETGGRTLITTVSVSGGPLAHRRLDTSCLGPLSDREDRIGAPGQAVWLSLLVGGEHGGVDLYDGDEPLVRLGPVTDLPVPRRDDPEHNGPRYGIRDLRADTYALSDQWSGDPALLVARVTFGEPATVELWVRPGLDGSSLGPAHAALSVDDLRFDTLQRVEGLFDELRVGTSAADVLPSMPALAPFAWEPFAGYFDALLRASDRGVGFRERWGTPSDPRSGSAGWVPYVSRPVVRALEYSHAGRSLVTLDGALYLVGGPPPQRVIDRSGLSTDVVNLGLGGDFASSWVSFLMAGYVSDAPDGEGGGLYLYDGGYDEAQQRLLIGIPRVDVAGGRPAAFGLESKDVAETAHSSVAVPEMPDLEPRPLYVRSDLGDIPIHYLQVPDADELETHLLLVHVQHNSIAALVSLWVDPPLVEDSAALPTADAELFRSNFRFDRVRLNANLPGVVVDELRVGPSVGSVLPTES